MGKKRGKKKPESRAGSEAVDAPSQEKTVEEDLPPPRQQQTPPRQQQPPPPQQQPPPRQQQLPPPQQQPPPRQQQPPPRQPSLPPAVAAVPDEPSVEQSFGAMAIEPDEEPSMETQSVSKSKRQRKKKRAQKDAEPAQHIPGLTFSDSQRKTASAEIVPPGFTKQPTPTSDFPSLAHGAVSKQEIKKPEQQQVRPQTISKPQPRQQPIQPVSPAFPIEPSKQPFLTGPLKQPVQAYPPPHGVKDEPRPFRQVSQEGPSRKPSPHAGASMQQPPQAGASMRQPPPQAAASMRQPPPQAAASMQQFPPQAAASMQQFPQAAAPMRQPPQAAASMRQPPPQAAASMQQFPPQAAASMQQFPQAAAPMRQPPQAAAIKKQPFQTGAIKKQPPQAVASMKQTPQTGSSSQQLVPTDPSQKSSQMHSHPSGAGGEPHMKKQEITPDISGGLKPPRRKGFGTLGTKILLRANHFEVTFPNDRVIYHYDVDFRPDVKSQKALKRQIIDQMVNTHPDIFRNIKCVFDGEKNLYSIHDLQIGATGITVTVALNEGGGRGRNEFEVQIKQVAEVQLMALKEFLEGRVRDIPQTQVQSLDIVLRHLPSMKFTTVGRSVFPGLNASEPLGGGVEMWRGFYLSLRPGLGGGGWKKLQLNLDISNRTFYKSQPVIDFVCEYFEIYARDLGRASFPPYKWQEFAREIKRMKVEVTHTYPMKRKYNIINVTNTNAETTKFPMKLEDGSERSTSVAKYFLDQYKMKLAYPNLPCLQASPADKHRYLPMEVCKIVPGQQCKKLTDIQTSDMIRKSAVPAPEREAEIRKLIQQADFNNDPYVQEFGLSVSDKLMSFNGRILPPPRIELAGEKKVEPRSGVWKMTDGKLCEGKNLHLWVLVNFDRYLRDVNYFVQEFRKTGREMGIDVQEPIHYCKSDLNIEKIEPMYKDFKQKFPNLQLIINVLPGKTPIYAEIKRIGDTVTGIATQCIQSKNLKRLSPATLVNIFLKINAKLGGTNSKVEVLRSPTSNIFKQPVIFFGADVTHPPAGDKSKPSIAAIVASMDTRASLYSAKVSVQKHRIEIIQDLRTYVRELLIEFKNKLNAEPARIIFYRDGVGEGQFAEVLYHELTAIRQACTSLHQNFKPKITFLVVQKRHHTRLFCDDRNAIGKSKNVPPGTTVDHTITHPIENDFYLCSHQGIQGTSRPTHYHVLWDDSDFNPDELQMLTYQLCHTYVRCSRSVSIPAPAYYAHLVAFRARYHLEKEQKSMDTGKIDSDTSFKRMKEAVLIHSKLQKMYFV